MDVNWFDNDGVYTGRNMMLSYVQEFANTMQEVLDLQL